jgi:isopentenyl diphosphate isomerase/L-lactate dehydrogenase-like FMN-dependent dehydrogenase
MWPTVQNLVDSPIHTIGQLVSAARARLPQSLWDYIEGGTGAEHTVAGNLSAFDGYRLIPRILPGSTEANTKRTFLGSALAAPILFAPVGSIHLMCENAIPIAADVAGRFGLPLCVSTAGAVPLESVPPWYAGQHLMFQLYMKGDRSWARDMVVRAEESGYHSVCITVDSPVTAVRDRDLVNDFTGRYQGVRPNIPDIPDADRRRAQATLGWSDLEWLRTATELPLIVKGVLAPADASRIADLGFDAIYVSNHGGRQLDRAISPIEMLPQVRAAVGPTMPLIVDGGIRRGADAVLALALGADLVGIGRLPLYGLAAGGEQGLVRMVEILLDEITTCLLNLGVTDTAELTGQFVAAHGSSPFPAVAAGAP